MSDLSPLVFEFKKLIKSFLSNFKDLKKYSSSIKFNFYSFVSII